MTVREFFEKCRNGDNDKRIILVTMRGRGSFADAEVNEITVTKTAVLLEAKPH